MLKNKIDKLFEQYDDLDYDENGEIGDGGDDDEIGPVSIHGEIPEEVIDHAKEALEDLKNSRMGTMQMFKELVDIVLDVPQFRKWFEREYDGNEFDLRQELEDILTNEEDEEEMKLDLGQIPPTGGTL